MSEQLIATSTMGKFFERFKDIVEVRATAKNELEIPKDGGRMEPGDDIRMNSPGWGYDYRDTSERLGHRDRTHMSFYLMLFLLKTYNGRPAKKAAQDWMWSLSEEVKFQLRKRSQPLGLVRVRVSSGGMDVFQDNGSVLIQNREFEIIIKSEEERIIFE